MIFGIRGALTTMPPQIPSESEVALCWGPRGFRKWFKNDKVCTKVVKNLVITMGSFLDHFRDRLRSILGIHFRTKIGSDFGTFLESISDHFLIIFGPPFLDHFLTTFGTVSGSHFGAKLATFFGHISGSDLGSLLDHFRSWCGSFQDQILIIFGPHF